MATKKELAQDCQEGWVSLDRTGIDPVGIPITVADLSTDWVNTREVATVATSVIAVGRCSNQKVQHKDAKTNSRESCRLLSVCSRVASNGSKVR